MTYYTECPKEQFEEESDEKALKKTDALIVYRKSEDTKVANPFVILRNEWLKYDR